MLECSRIPDAQIHVQYYDSNKLKDIELKDCTELQGKYYLGATVKNLKDIGCVRLVDGKHKTNI